MLIIKTMCICISYFLLISLSMHNRAQNGLPMCQLPNRTIGSTLFQNVTATPFKAEWEIQKTTW